MRTSSFCHRFCITPQLNCCSIPCIVVFLWARSVALGSLAGGRSGQRARRCPRSCADPYNSFRTVYPPGPKQSTQCQRMSDIRSLPTVQGRTHCWSRGREITDGKFAEHAGTLLSTRMRGAHTADRKVTPSGPQACSTEHEQVNLEHGRLNSLHGVWIGLEGSQRKIR